jgi:hypothetical protein
VTIPIAKETLDQEFWERYAKHDKSLYYLYHLFRGRPLQDCLLIDLALMRQDTYDMEPASSSVGLLTLAHPQHLTHEFLIDSNSPGNGLGPMLLNGQPMIAPGVVSGVNVQRVAAGMKRDRELSDHPGDDENTLELIDSSDPAHHLYSSSSHPTKRYHRDDSGSPEEMAIHAGIRKDRSIANYYKRLTINNDIKFYQDLLMKENIAEGIKRNVKSKLTMLLMKKIEDRYDDI